MTPRTNAQELDTVVMTCLLVGLLVLAWAWVVQRTPSVAAQEPPAVAAQEPPATPSSR